MIDRFRKQLETTGLIPEGAKVLVGYSGGADSTCLLDLLVQAGVDVVAAHLFHGQREEAKKEQALCEAFANELGVPFVTGNANVPQISADLGIGLEEAGRRARYAFFTQAAARLECDWIATGHTRTDNVETVLLHLTRGSGLAGLGGIPERRENIIRPLLAFDRAETRAYCDERGLWYHDDPSNIDISFSRARVRHRVVPELRSINPEVDRAISRMAEIVGEEDRFLNGMAAAALEQSEVKLNAELGFLSNDVEVAFHRASLTSLPKVLFKRAIRLAVETLGGELEHGQTIKILHGVSADEKGAVTAIGGTVVVEWEEELIHLRIIQPTQPFRYPVTVPGETESEEFGWRFIAFPESPSDMPAIRASLAVELDKVKVKGPLYFRTFEPGDQMQPLGFHGHRKISDLLSEKGLTQAARNRLPIVCDLLGPLWIPGVCLDERVRKADNTDEVIVVRFEPLTS